MSLTPVCPTCCRLASLPHRVFDAQGRVIEGCIDQVHTPYLQLLTPESARWHQRPEAVRLRLASRERVAGILGL